jgi:hypothetical protein
MSAAIVHSESSPHTSENAKHGVPFEEVLAEVDARARLALPDQVVEISDLHATETGEIEVPDLGRLNLTTWSRRQLATVLGIRWDRWFNDDLVNPEEQAEEINRRFARSTGKYRIRARQYTTKEQGLEAGVLRGFVGPTYAPTDDREVFHRLGRSLGVRVHELRFVRASVTDSSSQYAAVSTEVVDLGVRVPDGHKNGFLIANSEVGARRLTIQVFVQRLVCTNGLVVADSRLLSWVHRFRRVNDFDAKLQGALALLPEKWRTGMRLLGQARSVQIAEPETHIRAHLAAEPEVKKHIDAVVAAFTEEPDATLFGIVQAMTRAARTLEPEERLALEEFAGRELAGGVTS